jgi:hypothetical protein
MTIFSCTTPNYDRLYANYLRNPERILNIAEYDPKKDHMVLDLCGGTGAVSKAMIDMGAKDSILVDVNPRAGLGVGIGVSKKVDSSKAGTIGLFTEGPPQPSHPFKQQAARKASKIFLMPRPRFSRICSMRSFLR